MSGLVVFDFEGQTVRFEEEGGEPWFVARDVCRCLGIETPQRAFDRIPDDEKGVRTAHTPGGEQKLVWVREPGLYRLIFESRKPEAERFKAWVFGTVLPTIRRTGSFRAAAALAPDELQAQLALVREARRIHGVRAARALWREIGLPLAEAESERGEGGDALQSYVQAFLDERCERVPLAELRADLFFSAYCAWAGQRKAPLFTRAVLGRYAAQLGVAKRKANGSVYRGLRLRQTAALAS